MTVCYGLITCQGILDFAIVLVILGIIVLAVNYLTKRVWAIMSLFVVWIAFLFLIEQFFTFLFFENVLFSILNLLYLGVVIGLTYVPTLNKK